VLYACWRIASPWQCLTTSVVRTRVPLQVCMGMHMPWRHCVKFGGIDCTCYNVANDVAAARELGVREERFMSSNYAELMRSSSPVFVEVSEPQSRIFCSTLQCQRQQMVNAIHTCKHAYACLCCSKLCHRRGDMHSTPGFGYFGLMSS